MLAGQAGPLNEAGGLPHSQVAGTMWVPELGNHAGSRVHHVGGTQLGFLLLIFHAPSWVLMHIALAGTMWVPGL